ncbi:MAG: alpha/beta fold hydrolase [Planctomycetota bacterium]
MVDKPMNTPDSNHPPMQDSLVVDRLCDEFEQLWDSRERPAIEDFLFRVPDSARSRLYEQLLYLELELLETAPKLGDYLRRFPDLTSQTRKIFDELNLADWAGRRVGPFEIVKEIARGGMGIVYLAKDARLERDVAIKMISHERRNEPKWMRRFRKEARVASGLNHPNIVTIYEIGEEEGACYFACEFVQGVTLSDRIGNASLPIERAINYAHQIASGMSTAHAAGVIHRDLKSDNVMIRDDGLVKILDFGLAKDSRQHEQGLTRTGAITGSVHFMSPEQARGRKLTPASDVFSFGVILHLMMTGRLPFQGETTSDVLVAILNQEPDNLPSLGLRSHQGLVSLIRRCLQKEAADRPAFSDVLKDLTGLREFVSPSWAAGSLSPRERDGALTLPGSTDQVTLTRVVSPEGELSPSEIRYARSGNINIAWQEIGEGPIDIVFVMGWVSHLEWFWKDPSFASFLRRLASFSRVILFDKRGTGLSDKVPVNELPDLESRMDDVRAVMEAAGSNQAVLCGVSEGGPLCALFAATFPEKTIALTMIGSYSRRLWAEDYPWGPKPERREAFLEDIAQNWGGPLGLEERAPSMAADKRFREWWASYLRMGASPGAAVALTKMNAQIDIRPILSSIRVPALVLHRTGDRCLRIEEGRYLAEQIPGATFVELPGDDHLPFVGDAAGVIDEIECFLRGLVSGVSADVVLASVLCVSVEKSADQERVAHFRKLARREIQLFRGKEFSKPEALMAMFDGPVRSVLCAIEILKVAKRFGIAMKCGLETGACNVLTGQPDASVSGPAVDGAESVAVVADQATILVTQTLQNLIAGSQLTFQVEPVDLAPSFAGTLYRVVTDPA